MSRSKTYDRDTLRIFWQEGSRHKRLLVLAAFHPIGSICLNTLVPLFVSKTLATLATPGANAMGYLPYLVGVAIIGIASNRIGFINLLAWQATAMYHLQNRAFNALLRRSTGFHNNNVGGKLVSDAIDYPSAYQQLAGSFILELMQFSIILAAGSFIVLAESLPLGLLVIGMSAIVLGWAYLNSRQRSELRHRRLKATKDVTSHLADTIVNIQTVKTFAREKQESVQNDSLSQKLLGLRLHDWRMAGVQGNQRIIAISALQLVLVVLIVRLVQNDPSLLGIGIFAFAFTIQLTGRLFQIDAMLRTIEESLLKASPMTEIILQDIEIRDHPNAEPLHVENGSIDIRHVHFRYQDNQSNQSVFSELNLAIKPGEKIGLVGPSGGGKSTLTRLLLRFEDITDGEITIDGQNIAEATQESLRQSIAYVPQEPLLFHRTIRENIAYGKPDASTVDIEKAAGMASADSFIKELPQKYDTIVGERGVKLSGGQRQRVAIARAILKNAPILILDEATSALDSESEVLIQNALWKLMEGRTAIVIAHRLSTIQKMDRILVMDNGKIVEEGSHKELLHSNGIYANLWSHQSGGFLEEEADDE